MKKIVLGLFFLIKATFSVAQTDRVNVFLGSSGDHGQLSPAASGAFQQLSIVALTSPGTHTGYEYLAKDIKGFTHNRFEGVGCMGSGGLILVRPFLGGDDNGQILHKATESASPGFYAVTTSESVSARFVTQKDFAKEEYTFPTGEKGFFIDLGHTFNNAFVHNEYKRVQNRIVGKLRAKTTCHVGTYTVYYAFEIPEAKNWRIEGNKIWVTLASSSQKVSLDIAFSAVNTAFAEQKVDENSSRDFMDIKKSSEDTWNSLLGSVRVKGASDNVDLFYSLLYRVFQSPYMISEADGSFRGTDGRSYKADTKRYHGWAIWDNYKTQLPLLELLQPKIYQDITSSIANLYRYGKFDFAGPHEPANSVRTEHAAVVLLDAKAKGYEINIEQIQDSLCKDTLRFDFTKPDKYLEACYDMWAMSRLIPQQSAIFARRSADYQGTWKREFKDLSKNDVDRMSARNMYQGTIRQYRWNVPFDVMGLRELAGGKSAFTAQLDDFFDGYYFNRANEPDMQALTLFYASEKPWRYQEWVHRIALDTTIQYYFNDNSRGIGAHIDRIYKNQTQAFVRTMDDDAGAMSAWWVLSAIGLHQPLVGEPVFYLSVPFFESVELTNNGKPLRIEVASWDKNKKYIKSVEWNGKDLGRLWIRHDELRQGGVLRIVSSETPTSYGLNNIWISGGGVVPK
ncbi:glycoside hydrolase domain-containing protein [Sphingobacterium sp. LRF_L2]|uniref:glycoside hydrolase domain-containing protein n=1 Tax=Sphingobacterium sp. LRF_L2 TaxID=3369421 RepID=UPI003F63CF01